MTATIGNRHYYTTLDDEKGADISHFSRLAPPTTCQHDDSRATIEEIKVSSSDVTSQYAPEYNHHENDTLFNGASPLVCCH